MKENIFGADFIEKVKAKNDIVNIIGKYVRLEKKGNKFWGCCPFHHEKTPSFCINEFEQFYHCFGCGESGDVITFLRKFENLEYHDAVRILAENAGMEMPQMQDNEKYLKAKREKDTSIKILNFAKDFYKGSLYQTSAKPAQEYIKKRKLTKRELDKFELGYSPDYDSIVGQLRKQGYNDAQMKAAGVCEIGKSGRAYDFLKGRLVFPIVNAQGDCIGFSGRDLLGSDHMKYKNTSATQVFNKSRAIYGINLLKKHKQEHGLDTVILVEGQFDVITMHRFGFENAVACLGTAVTKDHLRELKRFADNAILCLDGDSAGQKAALRTLEVFAEMPDFAVKVAVIPNGQDPDEFLHHNGADKLKTILENALTPTAFQIFVLKNKYDVSKLDEKTKFLKEVLAVVSKLPQVAEQEIYLEEIRKITGVSVDFLRRDLSSAPEKPEQNTQPAQQTTTELDANVKAVKFVLAAMLHKKDYATCNANLSQFITNPSLRKLYQVIIQNPDLRVAQVYDAFDVENDKIIDNVINFEFKNITLPKKYFESCVWQMVENELKFRKNALSKQYKEELDNAKRREILAQIAEIDKQLKNKKLGDF